MTLSTLTLNRQAVLLKGIGVIILASILLGLMAVFVRLATREMPPLQVAFVRFGGALIVLLVIGRGRALQPQPGNLLRVVQRGVLGTAAIMLYFHGIHWAGAALATLLNCTYPVFTALFATTLMGEQFDRYIGVALALSVCGVGIILNPAAPVSPSVTWGSLSALFAAVFAGGAVATARQLRATESALLITTYFMAIGAALTAPAMFATLPPLSHNLVFALAGVVSTSVGAQLLLHQGLGFAPAIQGSLAAATSVVTAAAAEALCLGEHLSRQSIIGAVLMLCAVGLAASRR